MNPLYDADDTSTWTAVVVRAADSVWDGSRYLGSVLDSVDESRAATLGLDYRLVRDGQFCAVAAFSREAALQVYASLELRWQPPVVALPSAGAATAADTRAFQRQYQWRVNGASPPSGRLPLHGRSAYADIPCKAAWSGDTLTLWATTGRDAELATEAATFFDVPKKSVSVVSADAAPDQPTYDAAIDAAIVARIVQRPIQVWPVRESDADAVLIIGHAAEVGEDGQLQVWTTKPAQPQVLRPSAALVSMLKGQQAVRFRQVLGPGISQLDAGYAQRHVVEMPRSTIRLDSAIDFDAQQAASLFAQESFADELAQSASWDPVQWRLQQLKDPAGRAMVEQVAAAAGWRAGVRGRDAPQTHAGTRRGQGFACAQVLDESRDPPQRAWAAWVVDVSVDASSGLVSLDKITVGHHLDDLVIADGGDPRWGQELTSTAQTLLRSGSSHDQWETRDAPMQTAVGMHLAPNAALAQPDDAQTLAHPAALSASSALGLPAAAAVANAIYDATGIRLREAPFVMDLTISPSCLSIADRSNASSGPNSTQAAFKSRSRRAWAWSLGIVGALAGAVVATIPWRPMISPVTPDLTVYSAAAIDRGRLIAAASDCMVCHTARGGAKNAGGLAMDTPFGTIYTTNITSDRETGLGAWSFAAFDRAMRQGISRDGRHLYPAFPYTSFAKFSDGDMQALYAFLMSEPAVKALPPATQLAFPYSVRPMMAYWNLLFHKNEPYVYDTDQSQMWNRGAYLVQGPGHCMACHSPRNALGAEKNGPSDFLGGGLVDGWDAPALNGTAPTTVPWTTQDTFQYLRTGFSERHGVAAGPMAPVVTSLQALPDSDIQAMAVYLNSLSAKTTSQSADALRQTAQATDSPERSVLSLAGQNIYEGACAACHDASRGGPLFGVRPSLPLNTNITADKPDNLIRIVLEGISQPADVALGYMPGFADTLSDAQIAELASYLRGKYAAQRGPWQNLEENVRRVRAESDRHAAQTLYSQSALPTSSGLRASGTSP